MAVNANNNPERDSQASPNAARLLQCPFCGGDELFRSGPNPSHFVFCDTCKTEGPCTEHGDNIALWNTRTSKAVTP